MQFFNPLSPPPDDRSLAIACRSAVKRGQQVGPEARRVLDLDDLTLVTILCGAAGRRAWPLSMNAGRRHTGTCCQGVGQQRCQDCLVHGIACKQGELVVAESAILDQVAPWTWPSHTWHRHRADTLHRQVLSADRTAICEFRVKQGMSGDGLAA